MSKSSSWNYDDRTKIAPGEAMSKEMPVRGRLATDFIAQMRENGRRRTWLFALLSFVMMLTYPMVAALLYGRYGRMSAEALGVGYNILGLSSGLTIALVTLGGILCAVEGFSWLHSRKKTDMYLSQPVTLGRRFAFTYLNGILLYFVPYLAAVLLTLLIVAGAGNFSSALLAGAAFSVAAAFVYFLAVYNLALVAVMASGRRGMTVFFLLVGFLYDIVLRTTLESYCNSYFSTNYNPGSGTSQYVSPPMRMALLVGETNFSWRNGGVALTAEDILRKLALPMLPGLGILLLEAVLFGGAAYYCYRKRPMEAASQAMVFRKARAPLKVFLMVPAGLLGGICFCQVSGNDHFAVVLPGLLLGVLFTQAVMEIIYEGDLRAFARHKLSFAAGLAATLFFYLFFAFDLSGYDSWVPSEGQVKSAAIQINFANRYRSLNMHVDKNGVSTWDDGYTLNTMKLTDVSPVLALARAGMGKDAARDSSADTEVSCVVRYDMKNGGVKYRAFAIDYEREEETLNILFADGAYQEGVGQLFSAQLDDIFGRGRAYYSDGTQDAAIEDQSALPLMQAYREDVRNMTFSDVKDALPCGTVLVRYKAESGYEQTLEYAVFPSYENTLRYLRGKNVDPYATIDPGTVDSVRFIVYNTEEGDMPAAVAVEIGTSGESFAKWSGEAMELEYTDRAVIEEVLKCLSPMPGGYSDYGYTRTAYEKDMTVWVRRADGADPSSGYMDEREYVVKKGMLPEFVKKDIGRE